MWLLLAGSLTDQQHGEGVAGRSGSA